MSNVNGVSLVHIDNFKFSTKRFIFMVYGTLTMYNCTVDSSFVKMYLERNENEPILEYEVGNPYSILLRTLKCEVYKNYNSGK